MIKHRAFFGDGERDFALTDPMIAELERLTDTGIGALFLRLTRNDFRLADLAEIIRLGLIGAGTNPQEASGWSKPMAAIARSMKSCRWRWTLQPPAGLALTR